MTRAIYASALALMLRHSLGSLEQRCICARVKLVIVLALIAVSPSVFAAWDLKQLMEALAQSKSGRATFVETKYIAMLEKPVKSSGDLLYTAPDRLEKRTLKPQPESMVVIGDDLLIERGRQKHRLQLQSYPELAAFINSIRGILAGDRKSLERNYRLSMEGSAEHWDLQLLPMDEKMLGVIRSIRVTGVRDEVRSIDITQTDGDRSLMVIEKLVTP